MKRAQGLPINTIVVIVLLLVVLLVVGFMLQRQGGVFLKATSECGPQGGECLARASDCLTENGILLDFSCPEGKPACCRRNV